MNGKLAEIFFDSKENGDPVIRGYCHVKKSEYTTKKEKRWITADTKRYRFSYRNKKYFDVIRQKPVVTNSFRQR